ncbi:6779_t:CDS:2 [Diversispora eburnea]|uniref:6779_t:CDS:1 n=1 Tax=Diversispora eburnea TaxID=1213867 RepID=A0A9N9AWQ5_9GLOM|nr:6779_t:CDS:2 [Diversispora eburnea]
MVLWKVEIEGTYENKEKLKNIETNIQREFGGVKLDELDLSKEIFSVTLQKNASNFIVQPLAITGGLGGTSFKGGYESVDLTHDIVCQRELTINRLLECLFKGTHYTRSFTTYDWKNNAFTTI